MIDTTEALDAEAVFAAIVSQLSDLQWNPEMTGAPGFRRDEASPVVAESG